MRVRGLEDPLPRPAAGRAHQTVQPPGRPEGGCGWLRRDAGPVHRRGRASQRHRVVVAARH